MSNNDDNPGLPSGSISIERVRTEKDLRDTISIFRDYAKFISEMGEDLYSHDFEAEVAALPGEYAHPRGELLLARDASGQVIGCLALRPLPAKYDAAMKNPAKANREDLESGDSIPQHTDVCEMKRLFVRPEGRGSGVGFALVDKSIQVAREAGYKGMKLDSLPQLAAAVRMYKRFGFVETKRYHDVDLDCVFFELDLTS